MTESTKRLVMQISLGTAVWIAFLALAGWFAAPVFRVSRFSVVAGALTGGIFAIAMLIHMAVIMEKVVASGNEGYAAKTTIAHSMIRKVLYIAAIAFILWKIPRINPIMVILGTMGLKIGSYVQIFAARHNEKREERRSMYGENSGNSEGT